MPHWNARDLEIMLCACCPANKVSNDLLPASVGFRILSLNISKTLLHAKNIDAVIKTTEPARKCMRHSVAK